MARMLRVAGLLALAAAFVLTCAMALGLVFGWWRVLPVQSGSMDPAIPRGAAVIVTPQSFGDIRVGQIIVYDPPTPGNSLLVHRVVEVARSGDTVRVRTRGDANPADDPWTAELADPPVWKVQRVVPHAGSVVDLLRNRALRLALFPVALLGFVVAVLATLAQMPSVAAQVAAADPASAETRGAVGGAVSPSLDVDAPAGVPMMTTVRAAMLAPPPRAPERAVAVALLEREAAPEPVPVLVPAPEPVPSTAAAADWYRDPTGRYTVRWFDGAAWTAHVAVDGERRTDPLR